MDKNYLSQLYNAGGLTESGVLQAVAKGWISTEDAVEILGSDNALETIRAAKLLEISTACNTVIVSGVDLELNGTSVHFNLSIEDQANIANLFRVVELGGTEFPYQADGGVCRIYTATEIASIYIAAQTLITTQTTYHNALKAYVQSLDSVESLTAVVYGMDLPEPYSTEMHEKLAVANAQMQAIIARMNSSANA